MAPYLEAAYGQYVFTAEFLEKVRWSPENRTDPTVADTDGDGFPDGCVAYYLREGEHYLGRADWNHFMDFIDRKKV